MFVFIAEGDMELRDNLASARSVFEHLYGEQILHLTCSQIL